MENARFLPQTRHSETGGGRSYTLDYIPVVRLTHLSRRPSKAIIAARSDGNTTLYCIFCCGRRCGCPRNMAHALAELCNSVAAFSVRR